MLLLQQRSKHPREMVITPKASTSLFALFRLEALLRSSSARAHVLVSSLQMLPTGREQLSEGWPRYPAARRRLFRILVRTWRITTSPTMSPPQRYPILMYLGSRFENRRLCGANGPNLNGCYFINTKGGGGSRRGGYSPG